MLLLSRVQLLVPPGAVACQAPLSVGFSRQEDWSCHFLLQGNFPTLGLNLDLLNWQVDSLPLEPPVHQSTLPHDNSEGDLGDFFLIILPFR